VTRQTRKKVLGSFRHLSINDNGLSSAGRNQSKSSCLSSSNHRNDEVVAPEDVATHLPFGDQAAMPPSGMTLGFAYQPAGWLAFIEDVRLQADLT
jgi:hypothetical protein